MPIYKIAFLSAIFFIFGVGLASVVSSLSGKWILILLASSLISGIYFIFGNKELAIISLVLFLGAAYYFAYESWGDHLFKNSDAFKSVINHEANVKGKITRAVTTLLGQEIEIDSIRLYLPRYPEYHYGDLISAQGKIQKPEVTFKDHFLKDGIYATMRFPQITLIKSDDGKSIISVLQNLKRYSQAVLSRNLPKERADFMSALILGTKTNFSQDFKDELSKSGTSHLVALSGYNVSIIASGIAYLLLGVFSWNASFFITLVCIFLFVLMAGAEASLVRAALMGSIFLFSNYTERGFSFKHTVAVVAALMLLQNPKLLIFDLGFELSFAALLGIAYIQPMLERIFKIEQSPGIFSFKKLMLSTFSAECAVLPLLLWRFGTVSLSGVIANTLILGIVPTTMFLGFITIVVSIFSNYLAIFPSMLANIFLKYILSVIKICSTFGYFSGIEWFTGAFVIIYYSVLAFLIFYFYRYHFYKSDTTQP